MPDILEVILYTLGSFLFLFLLAKVLGKKQIAQLDFADYVIGISIGSIAGNMATDVDGKFYHYLIAMAGFFLLDVLINFLGRKGSFMKAFMHGKPITIIYEGEIIYKNLKKSRLDINEFLSMCRAKDYFDLSDIYYAVLETSGELSIIPVAAQRPVVAQDLQGAQEPPSLPCHLVCDGKLSHSGLSQINKDESWLYERLQISNKKQLKQMLLVSYDEQTDNLSIHQKD